MARYNEILVGRFNRHFQKLLSMKGEPPAPQLSTEIQPSLALFGGAEELYAQAWNRFFNTGTNPAGGAGFAGLFQLRNPAGSNVVMVVERLVQAGTLTDQPVLSIGQPTSELTTIIGSAGQRVDARGQQNSVGFFSRQTSNVLGSFANTMCTGSYIANGSFDFIIDRAGELTILPGDGLRIVTSVLNQIQVVSVLWRERFLEESERT